MANTRISDRRAASSQDTGYQDTGSQDGGSRDSGSGAARTPASRGVGAQGRIPLRQIERDRRAFGADRLSFHLELRCRDPWTGLTAFADACGAAGLGLGALRCGAEGRVACVLRDGGTADLSLLDAVIAARDSIALIRWTTEIGIGRSG
ncbi:hypothetical protein [Amaricoccus sp. W119]|uniref:hypothetical protein n=1 Tax=Amaricoccus sp. W119 TaxID=3391833 RepID=UPI0039A43A30